ncbi:MAG: uracil phosphoribosyltransferase [Nitrospinota bacterium]|nr:MAG: uracil phosphoribosyltransferase [Nitrospinota bacterium]
MFSTQPFYTRGEGRGQEKRSIFFPPGILFLPAAEVKQKRYPFSPLLLPSFSAKVCLVALACIVVPSVQRSMREAMEKITLVSHPLLEHSLTILRNKETGTVEFRRHASIISKILLVEATRQLEVVEERIETPLAAMAGRRLADEIVVVPVLRAGLAMLFAIQDFLPAASVGFIGLERDEQTAQAHEYYQKLPRLFTSHKVMVLDPMLATGGSLLETVAALQEKGASQITLVCIVAAPEGIARIQQHYPTVAIVTAAIDDHLDARKFIVPGLGDFGDRYFGT